MEITRNIIVNLSPDELTEIVKDFLAKEGFEVVENGVDFKTSSHIEGYGMGEYQVTKFDGCKVVCLIKTERKTI